MKRYISLLILLLLAYLPAQSCTLVIISGKHSTDGRPIMWKHRDTGTLDNKVVFINEGLYNAVALINAHDEGPEKIWIGFNEAGFAIMNSASYNLIENDTLDMPHMEGVLMRDALLNCASVDDFEQFLMDRPKPMGIESNFGVIDAMGNAAYFETDHYNFVKIDVNDQTLAPHGYIVRSNYSFTGIPHQGAGYIRFESAEHLFYRAAANNNLSVSHLVENIATSAWNSYSGQDARNGIRYRESESKFMYFQDCINRYSSSASVIIQGVKESENPLMTTMWSMVGFPLSSAVVPVWITPDGTLPSVITAPGKEHAPVCDWAMELKNSIVPSMRGSTKYYLDKVRVFNADHTGITQQLIPLNRQIIQHTKNLMQELRPGEPDQSRVNDHYGWLDLTIEEAYFNLFGIPENH